MYFIDSDEIKFFCEALNIDIEYELKNEGKLSIKNISYKELCEVAHKLTSVWGDDSYMYITASPNKLYLDSLLKSGNVEFLQEYIKKNKNENKLLKLWKEIKEKNVDFDQNYIVAKALLACGAILEDTNSTLSLCQCIFKEELTKQKLKVN